MKLYRVKIRLDNDSIGVKGIRHANYYVGAFSARGALRKTYNRFNKELNQVDTPDSDEFSTTITSLRLVSDDLVRR